MATAIDQIGARVPRQPRLAHQRIRVDADEHDAAEGGLLVAQRRGHRNDGLPGQLGLDQVADDYLIALARLLPPGAIGQIESDGLGAGAAQDMAKGVGDAHVAVFGLEALDDRGHPRDAVRRLEQQIGDDIGAGQGHQEPFRRVGQGLVLARGQLAELAHGFDALGASFTIGAISRDDAVDDDGQQQQAEHRHEAGIERRHQLLDPVAQPARPGGQSGSGLVALAGRRGVLGGRAGTLAGSAACSSRSAVVPGQSPPPSRSPRSGFSAGGAAGASPSIACRSRRARDTRLLIVPTAQPQMAAASSYLKPSAPTSTRASRCSAGSLLEGTAEIVELEPRLLGRRGRMHLHIRGLQRPEQRRIAAELVEIEIAQDGEDPGLEVGARGELLGGAKRPQHRVLDQIVGAIPVAGEGAGEGAQMRKAGDDLFFHDGRARAGRADGCGAAAWQFPASGRK